jgi:hypothetical protein
MAELWRQLHKHALKYEGINDVHFITVWSGKIPRYTSSRCRCVEFWGKWRLANPPTFTKEKYFNWTVDAHNAVNRKLNKPIMSYEDALNLYSEQILENPVKVPEVKVQSEVKAELEVKVEPEVKVDPDKA